MVLCGLGMQQYAMHNAAIQKTTFFEIGVYLETAVFVTKSPSNKSFLSYTNNLSQSGSLYWDTNDCLKSYCWCEKFAYIYF